MSRPADPSRLRDSLLEQGVVTAEQFEQAISAQAKSGLSLEESLVDQGVISGATLVKALGRSMGVRACHLRHGLVDPELLELIGHEEAERLKVLPMFDVNGTLTIAMADPRSLPVIDRLRQLTQRKIRPVLALEANILEYIAKYADGSVNIDSFLTSLSESDLTVVEREAVDEGPATDLDNLVDGSPIVNLVNLAMLTAIRERASDIHIEPSKGGTRIRYRVDGGLRDLMNPPPGMHAAIVSRIKVIGKMDIAEKRLPQEGRVRLVAERREVDLRVSSMPTLLGEKLVIRILDKANLTVRLDDLGLREAGIEKLNRILEQPYGITLVTGPTGSGKTTTLYSALDLLRSPERNIVTVEDPVEYQLDLINQVQVQESIGLSFSRVLRSVLRQDPDIIMVGEIRDEDTARVAVRAALTGHMVLATLHTNDAPGAVARLLDMNIESYLLSSAVNGVVAQRLVRRNCATCESKYFPSEETLRDAGLIEHVGRPFKKGAGCEECRRTGFQGRCGIYEIMEVTGSLRRMIHRAAPVHELRDKSSELGNLTLREEAIELALSGRTSLEEALHVTYHDDEETADAPDITDTQPDTAPSLGEAA
ncbi:MAG: GspE/PulE family protein [Phycisphaerales bacterium]